MNGNIRAALADFLGQPWPLVVSGSAIAIGLLVMLVGAVSFLMDLRAYFVGKGDLETGWALVGRVAYSLGLPLVGFGALGVAGYYVWLNL